MTSRPSRHVPSPAHLSEEAPQLVPEELRMTTSNLYEWRDPPNSDDLSAAANHHGRYKSIRRSLDWRYHHLPTRERQLLQDEIVQEALNKHPGNFCWIGSHHELGNAKQPLALFTAGAMGAGKGHTLRAFLNAGVMHLPHDFVWVDPDALAQQIPERPQYIAFDQKAAVYCMHPEAALLAEILAGVAYEARRSMVMDGSLSDCAWFSSFMKKYRDAGYGLEILYVYAGLDVMIERAKRRAQSTGRVTDEENIRLSREESAKCVTALASNSLVSRVRVVDNSVDHEFPRLVYDSAKDTSWTSTDVGVTVDVAGLVEGTKEQAPEEEGGQLRETQRN